MEKSGPDVQNEKLLALLKELASLQIKEMQVGAASFVKKTGRTISESVEELKKYLEEQSKIYKQSRTDIDEVIERYKGDLDARSKGIGQLLLNSIEKYFKKVGCEYVLIDVFAYNEKAINFYEKHDYHVRMYTDIKKL